MSIVYVLVSEIERRGLEPLFASAPVQVNCSYCVCNQIIDGVFSCDSTRRSTIETPQLGLNCGNGLVHVYRDLDTDVQLIPYELVPIWSYSRLAGD